MRQGGLVQGAVESGLEAAAGCRMCDFWRRSCDLVHEVDGGVRSPYDVALAFVDLEGHPMTALDPPVR